MKLTKGIVVNDKHFPKGTDISTEEGIDISLVPVNAVDYSMHKELNQAIWNGDNLRPEVADRLRHIAEEFYKDSNFKAPMIDIILTGSLANYNYHDGSDIDLHVLIDYNAENEDIELVKLAANGYRWRWNMEHNITIAGFEVECYIQDSNEPHVSSGIYSIHRNEWVVIPQYKTVNVDMLAISRKASTFKEIIEDLEIQVKKDTRKDAMDFHLDMISNVRYKVLRLRRDSFEQGLDEFSVGNLVFKELRNSGYIGRLIDLERTVYDISKTIY